MKTEKEIMDNVLLKEVLSIRIDTLWKMLSLKNKGLMPRVNDEGATGDFDNKGGIFIPGGYVFEDSDSFRIKKEPFDDARGFRQQIRKALNEDNATLIYHDGIATGVNLKNGFFTDAASNILANKQAFNRKDPLRSEKPPRHIDSNQICRSHNPLYVTPPFGSRNKLSSCLSIPLLYPTNYYIQCDNYLRMSEDEKVSIYQGIRRSKRPIIDKDNVILYQPQIVVMHTTRYKEEIYTGITRILGAENYGEFGCLTLEQLTNSLISESIQDKDRESRSSGDEKKTEDILDKTADAIPDKKADISKKMIADYEGNHVVAVLRFYERTNLGKRSSKFRTFILDPESYGIDIESIAKDAKRRYSL